DRPDAAGTFLQSLPHLRHAVPDRSDATNTRNDHSTFHFNPLTKPPRENQPRRRYTPPSHPIELAHRSGRSSVPSLSAAQMAGHFSRPNGRMRSEGHRRSSSAS